MPMDRNPLALGFYTVPEAARLIEAGDARRIHGWLRGYANSATGPLLHRDYMPLDKNEELSFLDLMEVRAVEEFRSRGVKARTLRRAIEEARDVLKTEHPFATQYVTYHGEGQNILIDKVLADSAKRENDRLLYNLVTRQWESYVVLKDAIARGVTFDPKSHLPRKWIPRAAFPKIIVDPVISYGRPALKGISTSTLYDAWKAEDEDLEEVAYWYDLPIEDIAQAVEFEQDLVKKAA